MLPARATPASQMRFDLAKQIAEACPPDLVQEIGLSGSSARGWSDESSDMELNLWVEALPPVDQRRAWVESLGAADLDVEDAARSDDSYWIGGVYQGVPVEIGWQTYTALDTVCDHLLSGAVTDRGVTFLADLLLNVVLLRDVGEVEARRARLRRYPERVQREMIKVASARFKPGHLAAERRLAAHGETLALNQRLLADMDSALEIVYAAHKRWMPGRKWVQSAAREFAPADWLARFDEALCVPDPLARVDAVAALVRDALGMVPCDIDVYGTLATLT